MRRFHRSIILLIVCILGLQTAAAATHSHFLHPPVPVQTTHGGQHGLDATVPEMESEHYACCVFMQSCFPAGLVTGVASLLTPDSARAPIPAIHAALSSSHRDQLLRPPRPFG